MARDVRGWVAFATVMAWTTSACAPDLGHCDVQAARNVVLSRDGRPAFEGQALMTVSCANGGFCHSPEAAGRTRFGVPEHLDFQVTVACSGMQSCGDAGARLRSNQHRTVHWAYDIAKQVDRGDMPPSGIGADVVHNEAMRRDYKRLDGTSLPLLDTAEGRHIFRNWLACGAPVVENQLLAVDTGETPGDYCGPGPDAIGDCVFGASVPLMPTWTDLYERFFSPVCAGCHGPGPLDVRHESALDLSTSDAAYAALVHGDAMGDKCIGLGTWVVPGDVDMSLLIQKMTLASDDPAQCGGVMPPGDPVDVDVMNVIREWITNGAAQD